MNELLLHILHVEDIVSNYNISIADETVLFAEASGNMKKLSIPLVNISYRNCIKSNILSDKREIMHIEESSSVILIIN